MEKATEKVVEKGTEKVTEKVVEKGINLNKGAEMGTEIFDTWMKSQNEIMPNLVKSQKDFMGYWIEATKKFQGSVAGFGSSQEGPAKEMFNQYNTWLNTVIKSSEVLTEEASKMQGVLVSTVEKQMETFKNFAALCKLPTAAK